MTKKNVTIAIFSIVCVFAGSGTLWAEDGEFGLFGSMADQMYFSDPTPLFVISPFDRLSGVIGSSEDEEDSEGESEQVQQADALSTESDFQPLAAFPEEEPGGILYNSPFERLGEQQAAGDDTGEPTGTDAADPEGAVLGVNIDRSNLMSSSPFFNLRNAQSRQSLETSSVLFPAISDQNTQPVNLITIFPFFNPEADK